MPKLSLSRPHALSAELLRERILAVESKLRDKYGATTSWEDPDTLRVDGPGVKGSLKLAADRVELDLDLSMMLTPLKGKIESGLSRELDELVAPPADA